MESPANSMAISMIDAWPDWPGNVVVLAGPVGSGKSHISNAWLSNAGGIVCLANDLADRLADIQDNLMTGANVVVEDAGRKTFDETALFHLINAVRQAGRHCLITSRTWPSEWNVLLPDLQSRLRAAQVIELQEPDDELLKQVMFKLFADRQLNVGEHVVDYCVLRMERSLGSASRLVSAIDDAALAKKSPVTKAVAGEALEYLGMN